MRPLIFVLLPLIFLFSHCRSERADMQIDETKLDAPLRAEITKQEREGEEERIRVFVKLDRLSDDDVVRQLEECGLELRTYIDDIITARGNPDAIKCATALDFVVSISLSQTRRPLQQ